MTLGSLYYVILFVVAAAWLRHVHRFSRQADAAHNALFVEDHLRFIELLLLAIAFNELQTSPRLGLEWWRNVKNPFRTGLEKDEG